MVTSADFHADSDRAEGRYSTDAESFRSAFDYAAIGMALVASDGRWLKVNRSVCELLGYSEPELLATNFQALTHPEDLDADLSYVRQLLRGEIRTYQMEKRYFHKLGQIVWALLSVSLVRDGEGNPIYLIAQIQNITDRKQAEETLQQINAQLERRGQERADALLRSEQRYRSLVKATAQVVWLADPEGKALGTMADWREYTGQPTEQMQGWGWLEAIHPEDRERTRRNWTKAVETQSFYKAEYRLRTRDGSYRHHIAKAVPILEADGNIREWVGANTDITEQKQAERARRKSDKLYRTLARNFPNGSVLLFDRDLRYLIAEGVSLGEAGKEQLEGRTMWEALPEQTCGILEPLYRAALAGETRITEIPHSGLIYQVHTLPVKNEQGEIFAGMVMAQDITLYKQAEAVLQRARDLLEMRVRERTQELTEANAALQAEISDRQLAEQRLEKLADELKRSNQELEQFAYVASHDLQEPLRAVTGYTQLLELEYRDNLDETALDYMNFIVDGAGRMQQLIQDLLAYSRVGTHAGEFTPVDCNAVVKQVLQNLQVAIARARDGEFVRDELPIRSKTETLVWTDFSLKPLKDERGQVIMLIAEGRDISDRKLAETEILKTLARERELNQLKSSFVAMVSHEFRNPLTTIKSSSEILQRYEQKLDRDKKSRHFNRIQNSLNGMIELLDEILLLGKSEAGKLQYKPVPLDLKQFCRNLTETLQQSAGEPHKIIFTCQGEVTQSEMDEALLGHIFSNLLSNAVKYSPAGGTVWFNLLCQNGIAQFQIRDEGIGIPLNDQKHLFDTFHRASNVGQIKGTGLGLSIVKKCVELHRGQIRVESEVGVGTTFIVTLPANQPARLVTL